MEDVVRLLLTRTLCGLLLVVSTRLVGVPFPVTPKHNSVLAMLTVGIPILAIAAWARPGPPQRVIRSAAHFVVPASFTILVVALATYVGYLGTTGDGQLARTALTTVSVLCGLALVPFVEPPTAALVGGDELSGDWRPTLLALAMLVLLAIIMAVPPMRTFFELRVLGAWDYSVIALVTAVWALLLRSIWRARLVERFLDAGGDWFPNSLAPRARPLACRPHRWKPQHTPHSADRKRQHWPVANTACSFNGRVYNGFLGGAALCLAGG
jgi:cation-transporting ATPase E